ncbi:hypothetical protein ZOSMA_66G00140 [Zostera marina]|uniref:Uncharacterized protein n=1 Tax=Zostera marina TaxID=29655 RepID=A0A0K9NSM0_ZOSMR|nr:hypothetical protein ZOSMA_66G00140 [Zostera marina]
MTFCSRFLHNVKTKSNKMERYIDGYYSASTHTSLTKLEHGQVHRYIIFNLDITEIFRNFYIDDLKQRENLIDYSGSNHGYRRVNERLNKTNYEEALITLY